MTWVMVDVEADGPCPGLYSMVSFGAVIVEPKLEKTFYGELRPISSIWMPESLAIANLTREQTLKFNLPIQVMREFKKWLSENAPRPMFISDNNGYDWQFINYYFHAFSDDNPFGHSSTNLGSLYKGMEKDFFKSFKHLRITSHTHHPVDDARGNAEALLYMKEHMGLKIKL